MSEQRQDAAKNRQDYLLAIVGTYGMLCIGLGFAVVFGILTLVCASMCGEGSIGISFVAMAITGALAFSGIHTIRTANKRAANITYVPPVREQIAVLPAEAILLRSSDQPGATPGELLRAVRAGETADEAGELLRAESRTTK